MDLNSYFELLATEHVLINHTAAKPAYFREYSSARILLDGTFYQNLRNSGDNVLVSQFNDDGNIPAPMTDFKREGLTGTLYIFSRIQNSDREAARLVAKGIRNDIIKRLEKEMRDGDIEKTFTVEQISSNTIGRVADNFFGIAINISYTQKYTAQHSDDNWNYSVS